MPSVRDLAARLGDALKTSEFRDNPDLYFLDRNPSELQRIQWLRFHDVTVYVKGDDRSELRTDLYQKDLRDYQLATALCRKLKLPHKEMS